MTTNVYSISNEVVAAGATIIFTPFATITGKEDSKNRPSAKLTNSKDIIVN